MDNIINSKLQSWLNDDNRTIADGCLLLLQLENNQIHYQNLLRHPNKEAVMKYLISELQKRLTVRLANITHEEVARMDQQVKVIVEEHFAYQDVSQGGTSNKELRKGKRADHDQLPEEIQALYVENMDLLRRMREVHLKLRSLSTEHVSCPDNERYPFLKEIIALDKQLHENWKTYDHYVIDTSVVNGTDDLVYSNVGSAPDGSPIGEDEPAEGSDAQNGEGNDDEKGVGNKATTKVAKKTTSKSKTTKAKQ